MKAKPGKEAPGNNYIVMVFDSCRHDSFVAAQPKNISRLGKSRRAGPTLPGPRPRTTICSLGCLPHTNPKRVFASDYYKNDFLKYAERLGIEGVGFRSLIPKLYFPAFLQESSALPHSRHGVAARAQSANHP